MNDYRELMQEEQMPTQVYYTGSIFDIEQFWSFEKFAEDNDFDFITCGNFNEAIFIEFYDFPLYVFVCGLDCASASIVEE